MLVRRNTYTNVYSSKKVSMIDEHYLRSYVENLRIKQVS